MFMIDLNNLDFIDHRLKLVVNDLIQMVGAIVITSLYRPEDSGIHNSIPLRALDARCRNNVIGKALEDEINHKWIYDPQRPQFKVAIYHNKGKGYHLHIQVHPRTRRREQVVLDDSD